MAKRSFLILLILLTVAVSLTGCVYSREIAQTRRDLERHYPEADFDHMITINLGPRTLHTFGWLAGLAADLAECRAAGQQVVLVSSGAIALGRRALGLGEGILRLEQAQAAAAVGQTRLVHAWEEALQPHGLMTAQVLVTLADTQDRRRYLNGRSTLETLLGLGVVPVVNENDTVATDEIRYGDNDRLAARVALMAGADVLVLLSDVDGLYTADPRENSAARHLPEITEITPGIEAMAGGTGTAGASGGMKTKILAAKTAMQGGCAMAVMKGDVDQIGRAACRERV